MVLMGENIYKKEYPPHDMMTDLANITVNLDIYDLGDFDERGMTFYVKFLIQLHWWKAKSILQIWVGVTFFSIFHSDPPKDFSEQRLK